MERRRKPKTADTGGGLNEDVVRDAPTYNPSELPYVTELIGQGRITIGMIPPVRQCVAVAHDGRNTLAMLVRRRGETLLELLIRLEIAIARAQIEDVFTDEINQPTNSKRP